jgi:potassium/hydrogen antiporter
MESSVAIELAKHVLYTFALILAIGTASGLIANKLRVPDVAVFLIIGMVLGPEVLDLVTIRADSALNQIILIFGASYILFDGGATLRLKVLKEVWITIVTLATVGVLITAAITAVAAYYVFSLPFIVALLLALVIASTDPATLVPVFKQVKIRDRVAQTVMSESAFNDAVGAIATFVVLGIAMGHDGGISLGDAGVDLLKQAGLGLLAGGILGYLASMLIAHERFGFFQEYAPVVTLMAVLGSYLAADGLHASGFMAVFVFGIMLGNKSAFGFEMAHRDEEEMEDFIQTTAFVMRMFIFILLGAQVDFGLMNKYLLGAIGVVVVFMLVARPVTVFLCTLPDRRAKWKLKEMLFMCWTRETGVIPGALAGLLLGMGAPEAKLIASVTFVAILSTILIQATTTKWVAGKLGLLEE